jgi:hypothetical protein
MKKTCLLLLAATSLGACKKDSEPASVIATSTGLLVAKNWRISTISFTNSLGTTPGGVNVCNEDDFLKFSRDKSLLLDAAAIKCSPTDPQTEKGTWEISTDNKLTLGLSNPNYLMGTFRIVALSASTMHLAVSNATTSMDIIYTSF